MEKIRLLTVGRSVKKTYRILQWKVSGEDAQLRAILREVEQGHPHWLLAWDAEETKKALESVGALVEIWSQARENFEIRLKEQIQRFEAPVELADLRKMGRSDTLHFLLELGRQLEQREEQEWTKDQDCVSQIGASGLKLGERLIGKQYLNIESIARIYDLIWRRQAADLPEAVRMLERKTEYSF